MRHFFAENFKKFPNCVTLIALLIPYSLWQGSFFSHGLGLRCWWPILFLWQISTMIFFAFKDNVKLLSAKYEQSGPVVLYLRLLYTVRSKKVCMEFADGWIRTWVVWCWKRHPTVTQQNIFAVSKFLRTFGNVKYLFVFDGMSLASSLFKTASVTRLDGLLQYG